jgi:CubicO group peptidase (beta-lactamase class C family)
MKRHVLKEGTAQDVGMDPARLDLVRRLGAQWVEKGETPSLVLLVARRGTIVLHEAFGVRRPEHTTPTLERDSIFPLASCSKPLTAAAVMCLVEDGLIGLNRPLIDYIPEWDVPGVQWLDELLIADLLCHTSGIDDLAMEAHIQAAAAQSPDLPAAGPGQHPKLNARIRLGAGAPLARRPGTVLMYSNFGFNLLADIVRRVSGQPFGQFVQSRLFKPLRMHDSSFVFPSELLERRVYRAPGMPSTQPIAGLHKGIDSSDFDELDLGSGGAASTARDLAVFGQMLLNGGSYDARRVLRPAGVRAITTPQVDPSIPVIQPLINPQTGKRIEVEFRGGSYGLGMYILAAGDRFSANGSLASHTAFGHMGYSGAFFWADPEAEIIGVFLSVVPRLVHEMPARNSDLFMNAVHAAVAD